MREISLADARRIALAAGGFADPVPAGEPHTRHFQRVYDRLGVIQIDSVNVLTRAHYLPAYSRLGEYSQPAFDRMEYPRRRVFEYWAHMASYSPLDHHRLLRWRMEESRTRSWDRLQRIAAERPDYVARMRDLVADTGPVTASQVDPDRVGKVAGQMWSWHEAKTALEHLFRVGEISSLRRNAQFERVFDLTERVIPAEVLDQPTPSRLDAQRELLSIAARAHGIATANHLRDYFRITGRHTVGLLDDLVEDGVIEPVRLRGDSATWYLHRDARRPRRVSRSALLSPFDPLVWARDRTERLWACRYRIEIYTPAAQRVYGYYVLLFLLDEQIAARVDLKADRGSGRLLVQSSHLVESCTLPPGQVADRLHADLQQMAAWLGLESVEIRPRGDLAAELARAGGR